MCALALGAVASAPGTAGPSGGTLRVLHSGSAPTLDPAIASEPAGWGALWYATCATLFAFRDAPAPAGFIVDPEAAVGVPELSRDGKTYVFTVRKGLRFSDGSPLTAANFARALGRVLNPIMRSEGASVFSDVRRVSASGRRLRIELTRRSGNLPTRLALPYACPLPLGWKIDPAGVPLMVGSGPYYVARYEPGRLAVLERNPHYRGSRPHRVDRIVLTIGGDLDTNIRAVAEGRADVLATEMPSEVRVDLARRYGVNQDQFFLTRGTSVTALLLNTSRPLFRGNAPLRKAVNLALDRATIGRATAGWPVSRTSTDQILTHWMPGWVDHHLYPLKGPNIQLARRFAAGHLRGGKAILWVSTGRGSLDQAEIIVSNLRKIGLEVEVKVLANEVVNATASVPGAAYDMSLGTMPLGFPDPANVIIRLLGGENARKPADNSNYAYFDVPAYNRRMSAANRLVGSTRWRAFAQLDADIMRNEAPWAPLNEGSSSLFVSKRVGCLEMHPVFRTDVAAICLQ
jgi:peptide/nickel transport system substrate-binding protein